MAYCPHCGALFFNAEALLAHRKKCNVWEGEKKSKPEPIEPVHDAYDDWSNNGQSC